MANYNSNYTGTQIDNAVGKALNPDTTPTVNSGNLITSGGVATALATIAASISSVGGLRQAQNIADGTDLDSINTPGAYYSQAAAHSQTLVNCPTGNAFAMLVLSRGATTKAQVIFDGTSIFTRSLTTGASWRRFSGEVV